MDKYLHLIRNEICKWTNVKPDKYALTHFRYAVNDYVNYLTHNYHLMKHCPYYYTNTKKICINDCTQCWIKNIKGDANE